MTIGKWITKKKKDNTKFYGYTGPVKPDMKSYAVTKEGIKYITTKEGVVKQKKSKWISKKGMKGRDKKTGRFISNMSLAFIIGRAIKKDGIQGINFFQKPLGLGLKQFGKDLLGAVKEDIIEGLTTVN